MNADESSLTSTLALLEKLKSELPELLNQAQVVGRWVWLEFNVAPDPALCTKLKALGFHWNSQRKCWQHPCRQSGGGSPSDPKSVYRVVPAAEMQLNEAIPDIAARTTKDYKIVALRECPVPEDMQMCETPEMAAEYWRLHVETIPYFNADCECFAILLLNTRRRVKGHQLVSIGILDTILVNPREVFRLAVLMGGISAISLLHNHPSGDPTPSEADIKVTRDLIRAGQLLRIDVLDHVVVGAKRHCSLREMGYFAA